MDQLCDHLNVTSSKEKEKRKKKDLIVPGTEMKINRCIKSRTIKVPLYKMPENNFH